MFNEKDRAIKMLREGLYPNLTFGYNISLLSKYYKYINYTEEFCVQNILNWLGSQKIDKPYSEVVEEVTKIAKVIYSKNYKFIDDVKVGIYLEEMELINTLGTKGEKKVAFCMLFLSKIYADEKDIFYCRYKSLEKLSGMQLRQVMRVIDKLEENGFLEFISRNKIKKTIRDNPYKSGVVYKYPNKYRLKLPKGLKNIYVVGDSEDLEDSFVEAYKICINEYKFKCSKRFKAYIKNYYRYV